MPDVVDPNRRFVRVVEVRRDGFMEIEFAVGEPSLAVEMIIPAAAFDDFCRTNAVTVLESDGRDATPQDGDDWDWNLRAATRQRFR